MSAKTEAPAAPAKEGGDATAALPGPAGAAKAANPLIPILASVILAPAVTFATVQFVVLPRMMKKLSAPPPAAAAAAESAPAAAEGEGKSSGEGEGKGEGKGGPPGYQFDSVVVNLAGTMGTRYLKTSFLVTGADPKIKSLFEGNKPRLTDVTLNVLSSLTLADLEEPGSKNVIRERLVAAYNQALGHKVAEQVYFSDFVIQ